MSEVVYFDTPEELAVAAAGRIVKYSDEAIRNSGKFTIALSGGNTPAKLYALLAESPYKEQLDWKNIFVFWGDERCVPANSSDNNSYNATEVLLSRVTIPVENIFPIPVHLSPDKAASSYGATIRQVFKTNNPGFDLILLGMGANGHTASLFPHTEILHGQHDPVKEVYVEEVNMWRISFTAPLINNAKHILFLMTLENKKEMLEKVLHGKYEPDKYPAQLIKNAEWFVAR